MDDAGDVWVTVDAVHLGAGLRVMRYSPEARRRQNTVEQWAIGSGIAPGRFVYDRWSDYAWWNLVDLVQALNAPMGRCRSCIAKQFQYVVGRQRKLR